MPNGIRERWDYLLIFPAVQRYLTSRGFPQGVSRSVIQDAILEYPEVSKYRIVAIEQCIGHALREMGYRKDSILGQGYSKTNLGILIPA